MEQSKRYQHQEELTLLQKISFDKEALNALEQIIYSIHLVTYRDDVHSKGYIDSVTNYLSKIIIFNVSSLGNLTPFHPSEKAVFEREYKKYILPFEKAILKLENNNEENNFIRRKDNDEPIQFEIIKQIATLSISETNWRKELNIVSWNKTEPKYDIRSWKDDHSRVGKGITLFEDEMLKLTKTIKQLNLEENKEK
ncbi:MULTISPECIES: YdbC family protein [Streptococcus]|uniref:YdbC family protein n=1 Tax=Streptococcus TaxID=1301 RepID=UPI0020C79F2C|nr:MULTISPECIES: PC4/YdbC family ssDNA-binding protein [Streptococcus]